MVSLLVLLLMQELIFATFKHNPRSKSVNSVLLNKYDKLITDSKTYAAFDRNVLNPPIHSTHLLDIDQIGSPRTRSKSHRTTLGMWEAIKLELLENSTTIYKSRWVGQCANSYDHKTRISKAFIIDEIPNHISMKTLTLWTFIEFYPKCCSLKSTTQVSFYFFRDCRFDEQQLLITHALSQRNESMQSMANYPCTQQVNGNQARNI